MITQFAIFEKIHLEEWNKKTGYYVIMTEGGDRDKDIRFRNFLENNIGKIIKMYYPGSWFDVEYDNVPEVIKKYLNDKNFNSAQILHISPNKEDLEPFIKAKKYNL